MRSGAMPSAPGHRGSTSKAAASIGRRYEACPCSVPAKGLPLCTGYQSSGGNPHTAAACLNVGDRRLIEDGIARTTPARATTRARLELDGTQRVGSGNPGMPCWRMHFATLSIWAFARAKPGSSLAQARADLNAGEDGVIPEPWCMGTPCARRHRLKARTASLRDVGLGLLEAPPEPMVIAEAITTRAIAARGPWRLSVLMGSFLSLGLVMCRAVVPGRG